MKTLPMTGTSALREIHYIEAADKTVTAKLRVAGYSSATATFAAARWRNMQ